MLEVEAKMKEDKNETRKKNAKTPAAMLNKYRSQLLPFFTWPNLPCEYLSGPCSFVSVAVLSPKIRNSREESVGPMTPLHPRENKIKKPVFGWGFLGNLSSSVCRRGAFASEPPFHA